MEKFNLIAEDFSSIIQNFSNASSDFYLLGDEVILFVNFSTASGGGDRSLSVTEREKYIKIYINEGLGELGKEVRSQESEVRSHNSSPTPYSPLPTPSLVHLLGLLRWEERRNARGEALKMWLESPS